MGNHSSSGAQDSTDDCNAPADGRLRQAEIAPLHRPISKELRGVTLPSTNSVLGVSSSTDPVHVPSPVSRSSPVGAIKREVRGGGLGGKPSDNVGKAPSVPSFSGSSIRKSGPINAHRPSPSSPTSKIDHSRTTARESVMPSGVEKNRSFLNRQRGNRGSQYARTQQQVGGHTKGNLYAYIYYPNGCCAIFYLISARRHFIFSVASVLGDIILSFNLLGSPGEKPFPVMTSDILDQPTCT